MRTMLLAGCATVLLMSTSALMAQTTSPPAETPAQEAAPPASSDTPPSATPSAPPEAPQSATPSDTPEAPATPSPKSAPAARTPAPRPSAEAADKRRACRLEARQRGLRGPDASGHMLICLAEARLACTKEAVARTQERRARVDYVRECMGMPKRRRR